MMLGAPLASVDKYDRMIDGLKGIQQNNQATSALFELGPSDAGRAIVGIKIGNGPTSVLVVGTHHGNEYGSTAVAMGFAADLAANPLRNLTVYVVPVLNISGYNRGSRYESVKGRSIDPNRDYPGPCATEGPFVSQATRGLAQFLEDKRIVSSATLHTFSPAVLYPWGHSTRDVRTRDEAQYISLSKDAVVESGYDYGNSNELLYAADGTFEDYAYWKHGVWSLLFELGSSHSPSQTEINKMISVNVPGLRRFLENAPSVRSAQHVFEGTCSLNVLKRVRLE